MSSTPIALADMTAGIPVAGDLLYAFRSSETGAARNRKLLVEELDGAAAPFVNNGNLGATETFDFATARNFRGTLDADVAITVSNVPDGKRGTVSLYYSGAQRAITWAGVTYWLDGAAPLLGPLASQVLVVTLINDGVSTLGSWQIAS